MRAPPYGLLTRGSDLYGMDPAAIASALIAARVGQAQIAVAARLMRQQQSMDAALIQQLLAAANQNAEALTAAVQTGVGENIDISA
jgi:hypothetical protein